jgi:hypothetical protein
MNTQTASRDQMVSHQPLEDWAAERARTVMVTLSSAPIEVGQGRSTDELRT